MNETCEHTTLVDKGQITSSTLHLQQQFAQLNKKLTTIVHVHYLHHVHVHSIFSKSGGDSNDKPTAMRSRSMARSQCWATVSKRTGSLNAPDVNSTNDNQP